MIVDLSSRVLLFVHVALKSTSSPTIYERKTVVPKNGRHDCRFKFSRFAFVRIVLKSTSSPTIYERKTVVPKNGRHLILLTITTIPEIMSFLSCPYNTNLFLFFK